MPKPFPLNKAGNLRFFARQRSFDKRFCYDKLSDRQMRVVQLIAGGVDPDVAWKQLGFSIAHGYRMVRHPKFVEHIEAMKQKVRERIIDIEARKIAIDLAQGMADHRLPRHVELLTEIAESPEEETKNRLKAIALEKTYSTLENKQAMEATQAVQVNIGEDFIARWERVRSFTSPAGQIADETDEDEDEEEEEEADE